VFRVITVEREFGSGAAEIAREISERLGWKLWTRPSPKRLPTKPVLIRPLSCTATSAWTARSPPGQDILAWQLRT